MSSVLRSKCRLAGVALIALAVLTRPGAAGPGGAEDHSGHAATAQPAGELSDASKDYEAAMQRMHKAMSIPYTNDVDLDFVRGMIPHHQGAIEQAEILLKYSKNPRLRRLAGGIIATQRREIRFMLKWLNERETGKETGEMPSWMRTAPQTVEDAKQSGDQD